MYLINVIKTYLLYINLIFSALLFNMALSNDFKFYEPLKINDDIVIDGKLDENIWTKANVISDFNQVFPSFLTNPSNRTSVQVLYDDQNIYFAIIMYQPMDSLTFKVGEYDDFYDTFESSSDYVVVEIDSENKRETSYGFAVNVSGVRSDYMIYDNNNNSIDDYWNAEWNADVSYEKNFWIAEIKIPVNSLRFDNLNQLNWGVNFIRYTKYNNETLLWSVSSEITQKILSQYGVLKNLKINKKSHIHLKPYLWMGEIDYDDYYYDINFDQNDNPHITSIISKKSTLNKNKEGFDFQYKLKSNNTINQSCIKSMAHMKTSRHIWRWNDY